MADSKIIKPSFKELQSLLGRTTDDASVKKLLTEVSDHPDKQKVLQHVLGGLIEDRHGAEQLMTSPELNDYMQKIIKKDYPALPQIRNIIHKNPADLIATYDGNEFIGSGASFTDPMQQYPIRLGSVGTSSTPYDSAYIKSILAHEVGHTNERLAEFLRKIKEISPDKYNELVSKIGDLGQGGQDFLEHANNITGEYHPGFADMLNPRKANLMKGILDNVTDLTPDTITLREGVNKYLKKVEQNPTPFPTDLQRQVGTNLGMDPSLIPRTKADFGTGTVNIDRSLYDQVMGANMPALDSELLRSTGHHATIGNAADIMKEVADGGDSGIYEWRNIMRMGKKGKGLLSQLPIAGTVLGGALALATGDSNAASALPILGDASDAGDSNDDRIMRGEDKSRKDLANIEKSDVPKEVKLKALELYRKNNIY